MVSFSEQRLLNHNIVKSLLSYLYAFFHKPDSYQPQPQAPAVPFVSCCLAVFNRAGFIQCVWFHKSHLGFCSEPQEPRGGVAGQVGHGPDEGLVEADGVDWLRRDVYAAAQGHGANGGGSGFRALLVQFHASDLADFVHLQEPAGLGGCQGEKSALKEKAAFIPMRLRAGLKSMAMGAVLKRGRATWHCSGLDWRRAMRICRHLAGVSARAKSRASPRGRMPIKQPLSRGGHLCGRRAPPPAIPGLQRSGRGWCGAASSAPSRSCLLSGENPPAVCHLSQRAWPISHSGTRRKREPGRFSMAAR